MATKKPAARLTRFLSTRCRKMRPTRSHRPALWECMLGTVYAMDEAGECRYFDYDYEAARAFAGIKDNGGGPLGHRLHRVTRDLERQYVRSGCTDANPRVGKLVLWVPKRPKQ